MTKIVISQSFYFPWVGMLEQLKAADCYVFYDDVQFSKGSFVNRVQVKTANGSKWITVPIRKAGLDSKINEIEIDYSKDWINAHMVGLASSFEGAKYATDALDIASTVFSKAPRYLNEITSSSVLEIAKYFGINNGRIKFYDSRDLEIRGSGSQRVLDIVKKLNGSEYLTGHGAKNYLDHEIFEASGICVEYMNYKMHPYKQMHGAFNPYLTSLDLVANHGVGGISYIDPDLVGWREFLQSTKN